jgi:glc operon protein GlcG
MRTLISRIAFGCAALLAAAAVQAQQPMPMQDNPLDKIPDKMPFDIPYGESISLDRALALINTAVGEAKKRDWRMNVAVVDPGGHLIAFQRMDGAQLASVKIAEHKARTAALYRRETKIFENAVQVSHFEYIMTLDDVIASRGGFPLVQGGKLVGAIGCSGGTGSQDEATCKAAVEAFK